MSKRERPFRRRPGPNCLDSTADFAVEGDGSASPPNGDRQDHTFGRRDRAGEEVDR